MFASRMVWSALVLSLLVALAASAATWDRSFRDEEESPKFLPPSPPDSSAVALTLLTDEEHSLSKRSSYYNSCTGVYDRELIARLDRVCEDCYNLYRDVEVAVGCRKGCFHNEVFLYCVDYMFRPRQRKQYRAALQRLGK
ncbi:crustacean hyperglycemic hormones-like [Penaeus chinensis]|uniref:crustacean hyperglycemic hormones-like n=1 Tax=Penaeus chinensis TaxID=139456 RepID=UPI001FB62F05|nr:crustacean hyperglycemic hormones-like [Penaeus chinensis]